jgi:hypothetical protein
MGEREAIVLYVGVGVAVAVVDSLCSMHLCSPRASRSRDRVWRVIEHGTHWLDSSLFVRMAEVAGVGLGGVDPLSGHDERTTRCSSLSIYTPDRTHFVSLEQHLSFLPPATL